MYINPSGNILGQHDAHCPVGKIHSADNAAYIVAACNAYPRLVAALREAIVPLSVCVSALRGQDNTRPDILVEEAAPHLKKLNQILHELGEQ